MHVELMALHKRHGGLRGHLRPRSECHRFRHDNRVKKRTDLRDSEQVEETGLSLEENDSERRYGEDHEIPQGRQGLVRAR